MARRAARRLSSIAIGVSLAAAGAAAPAAVAQSPVTASCAAGTCTVIVVTPAGVARADAGQAGVDAVAFTAETPVAGPAIAAAAVSPGSPTQAGEIVLVPIGSAGGASERVAATTDGRSATASLAAGRFNLFNGESVGADATTNGRATSAGAAYCYFDVVVGGCVPVGAAADPGGVTVTGGTGTDNPVMPTQVLVTGHAGRGGVSLTTSPTLPAP